MCTSDGTDIGEADSVIRDRKHLADDGVIIVTVGINPRSGEILVGPDVDSHGVTSEEAELHAMIAERVAQSVASLDFPVDMDNVRKRIRNSTARAIKKDSGRRPVVLPVVFEV